MTRRLSDLTFEGARELLSTGAHALLPTGAVEAHGPHLPLGTDVIIAEGAALRTAELLEARGIHALVLPPISYSVAEYAKGFAGTLSLPADVVRAQVREVILAAWRAGFRSVVLCNAHLEPANRAVLKGACEEANLAGARAAFPDVVRREHAARLGEEFRSGACHAGRYETSLVLSAEPTLVNTGVQRGLAPNPASLSNAIRDGKTSFEEAGGPHAYFGWPAEASKAEGDELYRVMAEIFAAAVEAFETNANARG